MSTDPSPAAGAEALRWPTLGPRASGSLAAAVTAAVYAQGIDRALGYDAAETVGYFVLAPSPTEALTKQRAFNNHPLFSFLERLVVEVAGHSDEWVLRLLPIACAAASVGVLVWAVARSLGGVPCVVVGLVTASNPMFIEVGRAVRGYSLMLLLTIVTTILHLRLLRDPTRELRAAYVLLGCAGLFTHLFVGPVFAAHALDVLRRRRVDRSWWTTWGAIGVATLLFYGPMIDHLFGQAGERGRIFRRWFLVDLLRALLGHEPLAVLLIGAAALYGLAASRRRAPVGTFLALTTMVAVLAWVAAPENLAPRFFLWALPGTALAAACAARRYPRSTLLGVGFGCAASAMSWAPHYADSVNRYPEVASIIDQEAAAGQATCATDLSVPPLLAYTRAFDPITDPEALERCDLVAIAEPVLDSEFLGPATREFSFRVDLDARDPAIVFSRRPLRSAPSP